MFILEQSLFETDENDSFFGGKCQLSFPVMIMMMNANPRTSCNTMYISNEP